MFLESRYTLSFMYCLYFFLFPAGELRSWDGEFIGHKAKHTSLNICPHSQKCVNTWICISILKKSNYSEKPTHSKGMGYKYRPHVSPADNMAESILLYLFYHLSSLHCILKPSIVWQFCFRLFMTVCGFGFSSLAFIKEWSSYPREVKIEK